MRWMAVIAVLVTGPVLANEPSHWIDRCLARWDPMPVNKVSGEWVNPSSCVFIQVANCRFVDKPDICVSQVEQHVTTLLDEATSRLPEKQIGGDFKAKSIDSTLEYVRGLEIKHSFEEYSKLTYWIDFGWLGKERQNEVFGLMLRLGGVLPLLERIKRYNAP